LQTGSTESNVTDVTSSAIQPLFNMANNFINMVLIPLPNFKGMYWSGVYNLLLLPAALLLFIWSMAAI